MDRSLRPGSSGSAPRRYAPSNKPVSPTEGQARTPREIGDHSTALLAMSRASCSRGASQSELVGLTALHDEVKIVLILEHAQVLEGIALDHDEVGVLAGLDGADLALHAEDFRIHPRGREQDLHGLHHLTLELELCGALSLHVAEQIGARADLAAGLVGMRQAFHALLTGHVDLLD